MVRIIIRILRLLVQWTATLSLVFSIACASKQRIDNDADANNNDLDATVAGDDSAKKAEGDALADLESTLDSKKETAKNDSSAESDELKNLEKELGESSAGQTAKNTAEPMEGLDSQVSAPPPLKENKDTSDPIAALEKSERKPPKESTLSQVGEGSVPVIPGRAVPKKGATLNRFYFVRKGETPESVSQILYGNQEKSSLLKMWNPGKFRAGKLVYYESPYNRSDKKMRSFYQERSVPIDEYTASSHDTLPSIAKEKLGSEASWKEIAVVNGLEKPDGLEEGQKLALYPTDLSQYGAQAQPGGDSAPQQEVAQNPTPAPAPKQESAPAAAPAPGSEIPLPTSAANAPTPANNDALAKKSKAKSGFDVKKVFEQNLFAVLVGGAVVLLLAGLAVVNKRKKVAQGGDGEFGDDAFSAPPPRSKRKS